MSNLLATDLLVSQLPIVLGGTAIGLLYGIFGVGSAFATPMLALLGVPGMAAVVGPLPALLPGSAAGAWSYSREGEVDWVVARRALAGGLPAAVVGALASTVVGFASGLLANGGGFLLVPLFLLLLGLDMNRASGTSLVVASALTVPTLVVHVGLGDIDYAVAAAFALGLVPGAFLGARLAVRLPTHRLQRAFGALLVIVAVWFLARQVAPLI